LFRRFFFREVFREPDSVSLENARSLPAFSAGGLPSFSSGTRAATL
jgi:hypothetical protein